MKFRAIQDNVIIRDITPTTTNGGLEITDNLYKMASKGLVISAGPGTNKCDMHLSEGDKVFFNKHAGDRFEIDSNALIVLKQKDIYFAVEDE